MSSRGMNTTSIGDFINNYEKTESSSDDESSGGWSDTDTATITSNVTDITYGTLGSAIVVDATDQTTSKEAAKKIRKGRRPVNRGQLHEDIVPGLRPLEKAENVLKSPKLKSPKPKTQKKRSSVDQSSTEEILFMPSGPLDQFLTTGTTTNTTSTTKSDSGEKKKKKKSKNPKSSKSLSHIEDMLQKSDSPKKEKKKEKKKDKGKEKDKDKDKEKDKKKKKKKKLVTIEEDPARDNDVAKRSKKKKKKKSKKDNSTHSSPARLLIAHAA